MEDITVQSDTKNLLKITSCDMGVDKEVSLHCVPKRAGNKSKSRQVSDH